MDENRKKALVAALGQIEKQFGKGSVMRLGDASQAMDFDVVPTGSLALDIALGVGGLPRGRVVEIYGPESSGKTTLTLEVIAQAQKLGGTCAFVDAEHALDPTYAEKLGVKVDDLLVSQPDTGEQALEITDMLVRSGAVDVVVVDSVAALTPKAEIEGEMGELQVGLHARLMSQALRKLTGNIKRSNTIVIFINQIRMKIGVMFGSPETTTGGNALKFYSSVRLDIRRIGAIKNGEEVIGNATRVKVVKNKVAPPFREAEFEILYGQGVSREGELVDMAVTQNLIEKSGSWYAYKGERIGQGKDNARTYLLQHPEIADDLEKQLRAKLLADTGLDGARQLRVLLEIVAHIVLALTDAVTVVAVPGAGLLDDAGGHPEVDDLALPGDALAVEDVELRLPEGRGHLVLDYLDLGLVADDLVALLNAAGASNVEPNRGIKLEGIAPGRRLRRAEHHADLHADLIDEDDDAVGALDVSGELAQGLGHEPCLETHVGVTHLALDLGLGCQGRHRVHHHHIHGTRAHQHVSDL